MPTAGRAEGEHHESSTPVAPPRLSHPPCVTTVHPGPCVHVRTAIADVARGFYEAFPDTVVVMDLARLAGDRGVYTWTYEGTNTGTAGTGHAIRFNGWERWTLDDDGFIGVSDGRFDTVEYERQLAHGISTGADGTSSRLGSTAATSHDVLASRRAGCVSVAPGYRRAVQGLTTTSHSISTGMRNGRLDMPTALRACAPTSGPNTSRIRSLNPLITAG